MLKQNKLKIIITLIIILIPMAVGCILWSELPNTIATHFGKDNTANGWSSKYFAVFGMPLIMAALHLICITVTLFDPKYSNIGRKPLEIIFWIVPSISLLVYVVIYAKAFNLKVNVGFICNIFIGLLFMVLGNILPKVKQNYSFGIKLPWSLEDEDNWNRTNHLAGWCMVIAGTIIIVTSFLKSLWILFGAILSVVIVPAIYSYILYYKKGKRTGDESN